MTPDVNTASPFVNVDEDGPYQVCVEWIVEDGIGGPCDGRMRPDGDRWRCPDCDATMGRVDQGRAGGGETP